LGGRYSASATPAFTLVNPLVLVSVLTSMQHLNTDVPAPVADPLRYFSRYHRVGTESATFLDRRVEVGRPGRRVHERANAEQTRDAVRPAREKSNGPEKAQGERRDGAEHHQSISFHTNRLSDCLEAAFQN